MLFETDRGRRLLRMHSSLFLPLCFIQVLGGDIACLVTALPVTM